MTAGGRAEGRGLTARAVARHSAVLALGALGLAACATGPQRPGLAPPSGQGSAQNGGPGAGASGLHGTDKPYQINGVWYYPHAEPDYDVVGYASWYGPGFHDKRTATGEMFDQYGLSAAHKTLPLPSIVEVTNLDNGRSIKLRLNDRGPFVGERVIDVSRGAAEQLGFARQGLTRVRVRYVGPAPLLASPVTYAAVDPNAPAGPSRRLSASWAPAPSVSTPTAMAPVPIAPMTGSSLGAPSRASSAPMALAALSATAPATGPSPRYARTAVQAQALPALGQGSVARPSVHPATPLRLAANTATGAAEASVSLVAGALAPAAVSGAVAASGATASAPPAARAAALAPPAAASAMPSSPANGLAPPAQPVDMITLPPLVAQPPVAAPIATAAPAPAPAPAAAAPVVAEGYSVQAGAFSSRLNAERAVAQLGASAAIRPLARGGATLYRVVLAGYADPQAAEAARLRAVAAGFADARVVSAQ